MEIERQQELDEFRVAQSGLPRPAIIPGFHNFPNGTRRRAAIIRAPRDLSLGSNRDGVLGFVYAYRSAMFIELPLGRKHRFITIDLSDVEQITLDVALIVTAEFHRLLLLRPNNRPTIDDARWPPTVRGLLDMLGFYELVQADGRTGRAANGPTGVKFVPFVFAKVADGQFADTLLDKLREVGGEAPDREAVYAALVEAILNVTQHAYPKGETPKVIKRVQNWWAAGSFDEQRQVLEFVVYDQGVGIPATLPRRGFYEAVVNLCPPEFNDADLIAGGIEYGRTRTEQPERGNGLWTICSVVEPLRNSYVRIHSGKGTLFYAAGRSIRKRLHKNSFCGTIIKWSLSLPHDQSPKATS